MSDLASTITLYGTKCAICGRDGDSKQLYRANFRDSDFNHEIFSARRSPDRIHYRMVKCSDCGLVRSDPVADSTLLSELYSASTFDYGEEAENIRQTYGHFLKKLEDFGGAKSSLLEIGCGNGFFLQEALNQSYATVTGIEPSKQAKQRADAQIRECIVTDIMRPGIFPENSFDTICCFQVLDHIPDPKSLIQECHRVLKPGGFILCLNHNVESISAKMLREQSPIIDIEHTYLFSPRTMTALFESCGLETVDVGSAWNVYSLRYLIHLLPMISSIKQFLNSILSFCKLDSLRLNLPLGNLFIIAQKKKS